MVVEQEVPQTPMEGALGRAWRGSVGREVEAEVRMEALAVMEEFLAVEVVVTEEPSGQPGVMVDVVK